MLINHHLQKGLGRSHNRPSPLCKWWFISIVAFDSDGLIQKVKHLLACDGQPTVLHEPHFSGNEWNYVKECLDTGWVSSVGKFVDRFESDLAQFTGAKYAIATSNGTSALHVCYLLAGI